MMSDLDIQVVDNLTVDLNQVDYITNAETQNSIDVFIEDQQQFESFIDTQDTHVLCTEESSKLALIQAFESKQDKVDSNLNTDSNYIVGAINEVLNKTNDNSILLAELSSKFDNVYDLGYKTYLELANLEYENTGFYKAIAVEQRGNITSRQPVIILVNTRNRNVIVNIFGGSIYGSRIQLEDSTYDWEWHSYASMEDIIVLQKENDDLRKKLAEVEQIAYAGVVL